MLFSFAKIRKKEIKKSGYKNIKMKKCEIFSRNALKFQ